MHIKPGLQLGAFDFIDWAMPMAVDIAKILHDAEDAHEDRLRLERKTYPGLGKALEITNHGQLEFRM